MIQNHIPAVWHPGKFFPFTPVCSSAQNRVFLSWWIARIWSQRTHFSTRNKHFYWNLKVAVLIAFVWPLVLLQWKTFGWVDFASNILQCGMKMYSVNNSHCVNIVWIEQVLSLVVIHPVFLHLNLMLPKRWSDSSTKVSYRSTEHIFKNP